MLWPVVQAGIENLLKYQGLEKSSIKIFALHSRLFLSFECTFKATCIINGVYYNSPSDVISKQQQ